MARPTHMLKSIIGVAIIVAIVLALPLLIPCALARNYLYRRHLRAAAEACACPSCGRPLGVEALQAADDHWRAHVAKLHRANPGARLRLLRFVHAICTGCCARLYFHEGSRTFRLTDATA